MDLAHNGRGPLVRGTSRGVWWPLVMITRLIIGVCSGWPLTVDVLRMSHKIETASLQLDAKTAAKMDEDRQQRIGYLTIQFVHSAPFNLETGAKTGPSSCTP